MFYTVILGLRVREGVKLDLIIPFKGKILSGETIGFYAFPDDADGQMAVTQFQSMNARMAYPCFDEPRSRGVYSPWKILIYSALFSCLNSVRKIFFILSTDQLFLHQDKPYLKK